MSSRPIWFTNRAWLNGETLSGKKKKCQNVVGSGGLLRCSRLGRGPHPRFFKSTGNRAGRKLKPFYVLNKAPKHTHKKNTMYQAMPPFIENKIQLGILNTFQVISGLDMLHKTGPRDSNLLSIQRWGKKNASYSAAVRPESWRSCSLDSPTHRKKPGSQSGS